jgi:hypothetical protein
MAPRNVEADFIRNPYRSELSNRLSNPRTCCPEYLHCSGMGTRIPVYCELAPKTQKAIDLQMSKLLALSDFAAWHSLRGAIRELDQAGALKTCAVTAAIFAVRTMLTNEGVLGKAKSYETAWDYGAARVKEARAALKNLERKIEESEARRPEVLATRRFTEYKRALCELVFGGLTALDQLYEIEGLATSPEVLEVIHKTNFRQAIDEILHDSSRAGRARYWGAIQDLLDGIEEILRRPNPSEWKKEPPESFDSNGNRLRKDVKKITASDLAVLKKWVNLVAPGLYEKIESASDQVKVLSEAMEEQHSPFPPVLSHTLGVAFSHCDDLKALRSRLIEEDRP